MKLRWARSDSKAKTFFTKDYDGRYTYRFPVYFYRRKKPILDCELSYYDDSREVRCNVFNHDSNTTYSPFYSDLYQTNNIVVKIVNANIKDRCKKFGIKWI